MLLACAILAFALGATAWHWGRFKAAGGVVEPSPAARRRFTLVSTVGLVLATVSGVVVVLSIVSRLIA